MSMLFFKGWLHLWAARAWSYSTAIMRFRLPKELAAVLEVFIAGVG
jgi:hypothetical protein